MEINGAIALVTGANRGLGRAFTQELLDNGATKVYAGVRRPDESAFAGLDRSRIELLTLDVTDPELIAAAAARAGDVTVLVNNAGTNANSDLLTGDPDALRRDLDTHLYGSLNLARAFAPVLDANGGGAIVNLLSAMSWFGLPGNGTYHVAKAAAWAMTNAIRLELAPQRTQVVGVHLGAADTDMTADYQGPKITPASVAAAALGAIEDGSWEVLVDEWTVGVKASLAGDPAPFYRQLLATLQVPLAV